MKKKLIVFIVLIILLGIYCLGGCKSRRNAYNNPKMKNHSGTQSSTTEKNKKSNQSTNGNENDSTKENSESTENPNAVIKDNSVYNCDIKSDQKKYDGHVDIKVGDHHYATQINDWYMYFSDYENEVVEIEGYYIGEYAPYTFIGRYGPSCPYCNGGYVSFEFLSNEDLSMYQSEKDWIKITGILREGKDSKDGPFYYIEVLKLEKMDQVGKDTVSD